MKLKRLEVKPKFFEVASYLNWGATALAIPTLLNNQRDYWYALLGGSLLSPFEWISDYHMLFMTYDDDFTPLFNRKFIPLFMFFAYGWFFSTTLIINLQFEEKLDKMPVWKQLMLLYGTFTAWDFAVEYPSTKLGFWNYYSNVKKIGALPWHVPFGLGLVNTGMYYVHKAARKRSEGKSFLKGLAIHTAAYWSFLATGAVIGLAVLKLRGHHPEWPEGIDLPRLAAKGA